MILFNAHDGSDDFEPPCH